MTVRVGVNGFGRIGRNFFRAAKAAGADFDFVAVNDLGSIDTMAHLLQNDSVHGRYPDKVRAGKKEIRVGDERITVLSERNPADLPWGDLGVDVVIESTGIFNSKEAASAHRKAGELAASRRDLIGHFFNTSPGNGGDQRLARKGSTKGGGEPMSIDHQFAPIECFSQQIAW